MKKGILMMFIGILFSLASCKRNQPQEHQHNYDSKEVLPTCQAEGYREYYCIFCQDTYRTDYVPKISHYFSPWKNIITPSCENEGEKKRECIYCGYEERVILPRTEHIFEIKETVPASCDEDGYTIFECKINDEHQYKSIINKTGHSFKDWETKIPAQCEVKGLRIKECSSCSFYISEEIPVLGHQYEIKEAIPASCEEAGFIVYECQNDSSHIVKREIDPIGHDYKKIISVPATCEEDGKEIYECQNDPSHRYEVILPKGNHSFGSWYELIPSTCVEEGLLERQCLFCGKKETVASRALGHSFGNEITIPSTCLEEGYKMMKCNRCGYETVTVTIPKSDCQFGDWQIIEEAPCDGVGKQMRECSVCKKIETITYNGTHHFGEWITIEPATEQSEGLKERKCDVCQYKETETIPILGHNHNYSEEWTIDVAATCTEPGSKSHHCLGCSSRIDITEIPASHQLKDNICTICGYEYIPYVIINDENNPFILEKDKYYATNVNGKSTLTVQANVNIVIYFRMGSNMENFDNRIIIYVDQELYLDMGVPYGEDSLALYTVQVAKNQTFKLTFEINEYTEGMQFWVEDLTITEDNTSNSNE